MLAIKSSNSQKCTPNLLPARVNHNGPVNDTERYWQPTKDENGMRLPSLPSNFTHTSPGKLHAYFRGRHLHGTTLPLPTNYTGAILHITDETLPRTQSQSHASMDNDPMEEDEEDEEEVTVDVKVAEKVGDFEEMVVWGHGGEIDGRQDAFVRGMEEWISFAEAIHAEGDEEQVLEKKG